MNAPLKDKTTKDYSVFEDDIEIHDSQATISLRSLTPYLASASTAAVLIPFFHRP